MYCKLYVKISQNNWCKIFSTKKVCNLSYFAHYSVMWHISSRSWPIIHQKAGVALYFCLSVNIFHLLFHFVGAKILHLPGCYYSVVTSFCDNCMNMSVFYISYKSQLTTYLHVFFCFFFKKCFILHIAWTIQQIVCISLPDVSRDVFFASFKKKINA